MRKSYIALLCIAASAAIVLILDPGRTDQGAGTAAPPAPAGASHSASQGEQFFEVTRDTFDGDWPLVTGEATLGCKPIIVAGRAAEVATATTAGKSFALNGTARVAGHPDLDAMWLDSETNPGAKVSLSDFVDAARGLCAQK